MAIAHVVKEGEHISSIAEQYRFMHYESVWNAPENATLREKRRIPHQLVPGDEVFIPDKSRKTVRIRAGGRYTIAIRAETLYLRVRVRDIFGEPIASASGTLHVGHAGLAVSSDPDGIVEAPISRDTSDATLEIAGHMFQLSIGGLHPSDMPSGQWGRMLNLDLWDPDVDDREDVDASELAFELLEQGRAAEPDSEGDGAAAADALAEHHDRVSAAHA